MAPTDQGSLKQGFAIRPDSALTEQNLMAGELQAQPKNTIAPSSSNLAQSFTVELVPGHLKMHTISEDKLEMLASGNASIHLTFFGICLGSAVSFAIVLYSGLDQAHRLVYESLLFLSGVMATYFGIRGGGDHFRSKAKLKEIKRQLIAP
jgi:hypothetical protein